jgi:hypothetical protein
MQPQNIINKINNFISQSNKIIMDNQHIINQITICINYMIHHKLIKL